jgi:hypothetical protein
VGAAHRKNFCLMKRRSSQFAPTEELSLDEYMPALGRDGGHVMSWSRPC